MINPGAVVSFEGIPAAGKSHTVRAIAERLQPAKVEVQVKQDLLNYEGDNVGAAIKKILNSSAPKFRLGLPMTETLLICAKRAYESQITLEPALEQGKLILADRDVDSVCVFQLPVVSKYRPGVRRPEIIEWLRVTNRLSSRQPAVTFYLEVSVEESMRREREFRGWKGTSEEERFELIDRATVLERYEEVFSYPIEGRVLHRIQTVGRAFEDVVDEVWGLFQRELVEKQQSMLL